jgi:serine protease Do
MKKWTGIFAGVIIGIVAGSFLVGPLLHGQPAGSSIKTPKELTSFRDVVKHVLPAVVSIETEGKTVKTTGKTVDPFPFDKSQLPEEFKKFFEDLPQMPSTKEVPRQGFGSGFLIDPDGVIMTSYHVVTGANKVTVTLHDGTEYVTTDVRGDKRTDLAVVRIDARGKKLPYLELGDSSRMEIGDRVLALGAPFGLLGSVTHGIISGKGRTGLSMNFYEDFLQTDAAINPGNSGGPLVNMEGKVIGINAAIKSRTGGFDGVGLAVASNLARDVKDALIKDGKVRRGYLGVQITELDPEVAAKLGLAKDTGVVVGSVFADTPAARGGLKAGDIITKVAGKTITDSNKLQGLVMGLPLGKETPVEILRDGKQQTLNVVIEEQPDTFGYATAPATQAPQDRGNAINLDQIGIEVTDLTPAQASKLGYAADATGVVITQVNPGGLAQTAGLRSGMLIVKVDNQPVGSAAAARDAINNASLANGVLLQVRSPQGGTNYVLLRAKA